MTNLTEEQVGAAFHTLRERCGMSKSEVARRAAQLEPAKRIDRLTIYRIEAGSMPSLQVLSAVARAMGREYSNVIRHAESVTKCAAPCVAQTEA